MVVYKLISSGTIKEKINTTLVQDEHLRMADDTEDVENFEHPIEWDKEAIWEAYDVLASEDKYLKPPGKYQVND
ncbi:MAG: hypothetical protein VB094_01505 [Oscillibacter sp.]|nr:hypothetical protein [Oscillibacter sp.]